MSKPKYPWYGYMKNIIKAYPELKETPPDELPKDHRKELHAVEQAIEHADPETVKLIEGTYWTNGSGELLRVAARLGITEKEAKQRHRAFILSVGKAYGLL